MSTEKMREEFEGWARSVGFVEGDNTSWEYKVWQASRAAIEVELPKPYSEHRLASKPERYARSSTIGECREAIESIGLKVKA